MHKQCVYNFFNLFHNNLYIHYILHDMLDKKTKSCNIYLGRAQPALGY